MHPTRDTAAFINIHLAGGRVMPGVRSPERAGLRTRMFHPGALERPNSRMHATADTQAVIFGCGVGRRVMRALDCWGNVALC
jgi:hypothetical protein